MMSDDQSTPDRGVTQAGAGAGNGGPAGPGRPRRAEDALAAGNGTRPAATLGPGGGAGPVADHASAGYASAGDGATGDGATGDDTSPAPGGDGATGDGTAGDGTTGVGATGGGADQDQGEAADGHRRARRKRRSFWVELPVLIAIALVIALVIKTFVVQAFWIPSGSMENTLLINDKVLVNKLVYRFRSIEPGDIVVFSGTGSWTPAQSAGKPSSDPLVRAYDATLGRLFHSIAGLYGTPIDEQGTVFIKRVIGVPGDHVVCCNAQGLVTVNGVGLHEQSYLYPGAVPSSAPEGYSGRFNITVPPGRLWVMGDNRPVSDDSRLRQGDPYHGTIPESAVIGRAFVIVWPPSQWRILPIPSTFSQPGIDSPKAAAAAAALDRGVAVAPAMPYLPLAAAFVIALPLTWIERRMRLRAWRRMRFLARLRRRRRD